MCRVLPSVGEGHVFLKKSPQGKSSSEHAQSASPQGACFKNYLRAKISSEHVQSAPLYGEHIKNITSGSTTPLNMCRVQYLSTLLWDLGCLWKPIRKMVPILWRGTLRVLRGDVDSAESASANRGFWCLKDQPVDASQAAAASPVGARSAFEGPALSEGKMEQP